MTQPQAQQQYVVIPGREIQHAGVTYAADKVVTLPEDVAIFHIEAGNLRGFVEKVDAKKVDAEKAKAE
jgi:hypothetical protein